MKAIQPEDLSRPILETGYQLGKLIVAHRKLRGISARALSAETGISRATLSQIEAGSPRVQFAHWLKVLDALDLLDRLVIWKPSDMGQMADALRGSRR